MKPKTIGTPRPSNARAEREAAAAAYDAMRAGRPLKPPRYNFQVHALPASVLALRSDKKAGLLW